METNCREFGIPLYTRESGRQGIVHVIGPGAGADPAGHDHRLRRQPHRDARRVRRAGLRHRHERGRARAGDAVSAAAQAEDLPGARRRPAAAGGRRARTSSWRSSPRSASAAAPGMSSSTAATAIRGLSMEERMTVCNMSIEGGARAGLIAPDDTTFEYLHGPAARAARARPGMRPWRAWRQLPSDEGATYDRSVTLDAASARADDHLRHQPRHGRADHRRACPIPPTVARRVRSAARWRRRWPTWG